jgi:predicted DNA binding protein
MIVVAEFTIPSEALPGGDILRELEHVRIELERIVPTDESTFPYFWVRGKGASTFIERIRDEPEVEALSVLSETDDGTLVRATWSPHADVIRGIRTLEPTIIGGNGTAEQWTFEVRSESRERLQDFQRVFAERGIRVELRRIYPFRESLGDGPSMTEKQRQALLVAYHAGYFDTPRKTTQRDLGDRLGISPRAVSNRLRRGTRNLITNSLVRSKQ